MTTAALLIAMLAWGQPATQPAPQPQAQPETPSQAQPAEPPPAAPQPSSPAPLPTWLTDRLAELRPAEPQGYFLLGEEVADAASADPALLPTARTLFVLSLELDRRRGGSALASSACLALADLERKDSDRRWLRALASSLDRRYAATDWSVSAGRTAPDETAYKAASTLGLVRAGEGKMAEKLFNEAGVASMLTEFERMIGTTEATGALHRLSKAMQVWPCPECGNERILWGPGESGPQARLCPSCGGNPGPRMSEEEFIAQLRFEAMLLSGIQRSWAAQVVTDQGAPLRDPDPSELAPIYSVDPSRTLWRHGRWTAPGDAD